jgi:hypothetical protein
MNRHKQFSVAPARQQEISRRQKQTQPVISQ